MKHEIIALNIYLWHVVVSALFPFLTVLWPGLQCVALELPDYTHFFSATTFYYVYENLDLSLAKPLKEDYIIEFTYLFYHNIKSKKRVQL